jgi:hypothetical protein
LGSFYKKEIADEPYPLAEKIRLVRDNYGTRSPALYTKLSTRKKQNEYGINLKYICSLNMAVG